MNDFRDRLAHAYREIDFVLQGGELLEDGENLLAAAKLLERAQRIVDEAERDAEGTRLRAQQDADMLREAAVEEGRRLAVRELANVLREAQEYQQRAVTQSEEAIVKLALQVAGRLVANILHEDPGAYVNDVLMLLRGQDVAPIEVQVPAQQLDLFAPLTEAGFPVVPNPSLPDYDVRILSPSELIEAGVGSRLAQIRRTLLDS